MTKEIVNFGASKPSKNKLNCFSRQFGNIGKKKRILLETVKINALLSKTCKVMSIRLLRNLLMNKSL